MNYDDDLQEVYRETAINTGLEDFKAHDITLPCSLVTFISEIYRYHDPQPRSTLVFETKGLMFRCTKLWVVLRGCGLRRTQSLLFFFFFFLFPVH